MNTSFDQALIPMAIDFTWNTNADIKSAGLFDEETTTNRSRSRHALSDEEKYVAALNRQQRRRKKASRDNRLTRKSQMWNHMDDFYFSGLEMRQRIFNARMNKYLCGGYEKDMDDDNIIPFYRPEPEDEYIFTEYMRMLDDEKFFSEDLDTIYWDEPEYDDSSSFSKVEKDLLIRRFDSRLFRWDINNLDVFIQLLEIRKHISKGNVSVFLGCNGVVSVRTNCLAQHLITPEVRIFLSALALRDPDE